ncbi:hypothetical protein V3C41_11090 [Paenarthrobacter nicotinovorans]|uniref:DUF4190 domain-containing protein n=1 Tax=Paenarthrobacter nicotinovorans TaxID=29320 RepID=A0ABV0GSY5_PAENI
MDKTPKPSPHSTTSGHPLPASQKSHARISHPPGLNVSIWSLALAMGVPIVFMIVFPVGMLFMFGAESPPYAMAAQTILVVPTGACWLGALVCGLTCLRLAKSRDADGQRSIAWMFGIFGLCIAGLEGLALLLMVLRN